MGPMPADPWTLFLIGLGLGTGPCFAHQMAIVVPFVGAERSGVGAGLREVLSFSLGRALGYSVWGLAVGAAGTLAGLPVALTASIQLALGLLLAVAALTSLLRRDLPALCRPLSDSLIRPLGRTMFFAGLSVAAVPCLPLLAVVTAAAANGPLAGAAGGLALAAGSTLSPTLLAAPVLSGLTGRLGEVEGGAAAEGGRVRRASLVVAWMRPLAALVLFGVGLTYALRAVLALAVRLGGVP